MLRDEPDIHARKRPSPIRMDVSATAHHAVRKNGDIILSCIRDGKPIRLIFRGDLAGLFLSKMLPLLRQAARRTGAGPSQPVMPIIATGTPVSSPAMEKRRGWVTRTDLLISSWAIVDQNGRLARFETTE